MALNSLDPDVIRSLLSDKLASSSDGKNEEDVETNIQDEQDNQDEKNEQKTSENAEENETGNNDDGDNPKAFEARVVLESDPEENKEGDNDETTD